MASSLLTALLIAIATAQVALAIYYPSCDPPHRPDNGGYNPSSNKYTVGSKINFFCNTGYKLHGASSTICKHVAKKSFWAHESPVCKLITCSDLDDPKYGRVSVAGDTPGYMAHYKCDYGYELVGEAYRECLLNGYWGGKEPVCKLIECPDLDDPSYGKVNVTGNTPGYDAHYKCDYGYELVGEAYRECLYNGYWSGEEPACERITCPDLDDPSYGRVNVTGNTPGYMAHYKCDYGYQLVGEKYRECLYTGYWSGEEPKCEQIVCPNLEAPIYGKVVVKGNTPSSKAHYSCNHGYKLHGLQERQCQYNGTWYGDEPVCKKIVCPQLKPLEHGKIFISGYTPLSKALYSCKKGYKLVGLQLRKCQYNGSWFGRAPTCQLINY